MFIRRIVLVLLVLSCSVGLAKAEWLKIMTVSNSDGFIVYGDFATHHIDEKGLVKMWFLYDYKTAQKNYQVPYRSVRIQRQYDCKEERARTLAQSLFDGNMALGNVVSDDSSTRTWGSVAPGTLGETMWKAACGKP